MLWKTSELINVFQDTQLIIENDPVLLRKTGESSQNTRQYPEGFVSQRKTVNPTAVTSSVWKERLLRAQNGLRTAKIISQY